MNQTINPSNASGLRDNHSRGSAARFLQEAIQPGSELSFVSAYFTVHAYAALKEPLEAADHLRCLFGDPASVTSLEKDKKQARHFVLGNERQELTLANQLTQKQVARDCAAWIRDKVEIRSVTRSAFLHGKLYHIRKDGLDQALLGSSNFTVPGLGLKSSGNNVELNLIVDSKRDVTDLRSWFDELWNDQTITSDVRDKVLAELDRLHSDHAPDFIYYLTLFHLFRDYIDGAKDLDDALTRTALPDTGIWQALYSFQKDGAKAAINKILATNGSILATYYKDEMKRLGGFPKRPAPVSIHPPIDLSDKFLSFEKLNAEIDALTLALYHPTSYLRDDLPTATLAAYEDKILGGFTQQGRERILVAMMKINFLKRLESSVDSFRLTLQRTIEKITSLEAKIERFEAHADDENGDLDFDSVLPDQFEDPYIDPDLVKGFTIGGRRKFHLGHLKRDEWLKAVRHDKAQLQYLLDKTEKVTPERDAKLAQLRELISGKIAKPSTNRNRLLRLTADSPDLLAIIKQEGKV